MTDHITITSAKREEIHMTTEEDHSLAALMAEPDPTEWGRWSRTADGTALVIMDGTMPRYVDLARCTTDAGRWFWVKHYGGKTWITSDDVKHLVEALDQIAQEPAE